jgi:hypothetical protein
MKKYFINVLKMLHKLFISKSSKLCKHGFEISEVMNIKIDPACKNCGQKLSVLKQLL